MVNDMSIYREYQLEGHVTFPKDFKEGDCSKCYFSYLAEDPDGCLIDKCALPKIYGCPLHISGDRMRLII